jgi:hypothetical protein
LKFGSHIPALEHDRELRELRLKSRLMWAMPALGTVDSESRTTLMPDSDAHPLTQL